MTSMIQSYSQKLQDDYRLRKGRHCRHQNELRTHVRAYKPLGYFVETNPFNPIETLRSDARSVRYFLDGIKGHGNDYSIGKINDVGIGLGALGIAGMLATSKGSPLSRGMEFVGLACWLGAMSLWQKIAINTPLKHLKGVDLNLEYVNSAGHRKKFYQDSQYLCWDLMSDEQIYKMGDKLGVPKNIKNRRKAIENKARQVAVQGNTLGLLTAGFATPLIASLAADKISKHVLSPIVTKVKEAKVEAKRKEIVQNINFYPVENDTLKFIEENVKETMTPAQKSQLKEVFAAKTKDVYLKDTASRVIDDILTSNGTKASQVVLDDAFHTKLTDILSANFGEYKAAILDELKQIAAKYNNVVTFENLSKYQGELEEWITKQTNNLFEAEDAQKATAELAKMLQKDSKTVALGNIEAVRKDLSQMSKMLDIYNKKFFEDFKTDFWKNMNKSEGSVQAKMWDNISTGLLKAFKVDNDTMKELILGVPDIVTPADKKNLGMVFDKVNIIGNLYDSTLADMTKFDGTMKKLGKVINDVVTQNDKHYEFSMAYLERIQKVLSQIDRKSTIFPIAEKMKSAVAEQRLAVLNGYITANEAAFFPLKSLCLLKNSKKALKELAEVRGVDFAKVDFDFKKLLLNSQSVDEFMNKLDTFKTIITDDKDYKLFVDSIFADVPSAVKRYLSPEMIKKMNASSHLSKALLSNLSDEIHNVKVQPQPIEEVVNALHEMNLYKYADEMFDITYNNPELISNLIGDAVRNDDGKMKLLKTMIKLTEQDVEKIRANDFSAIHAMLRGSSANAGYFEPIGGGRLNSILSVLGVRDLTAMDGITIAKSKTSKVAELTAPKLYNMFSRSAKNVFNYNLWFKRVGIAFLALCGVTAVAVSQMGKKNEFNPDVYEERKAN